MTNGSPRLALLAALAAAACSSYNRAPPPSVDVGAADAPIVPIDTPAVTTDAGIDAGADAGADAGGDAGGYSCERFCAPLRAVPICAMAAIGCMTMCPTEYAGFPASCDAYFSVLFACVQRNAASPVCMAGTFPYPPCMDVNGMARQCARPGS